jgi:hypothetical protein
MIKLRVTRSERTAGWNVWQGTDGFRRRLENGEGK